ncbi:MAG: hypothetical protein RR818_09970 [Citrobacter sp.]
MPLTLRSTRRATAGFARFRTRVNSNVERLLTRLTVGRSWPGAETQSWGVNLIYALT